MPQMYKAHTIKHTHYVIKVKKKQKYVFYFWDVIHIYSTSRTSLCIFATPMTVTMPQSHELIIAARQLTQSDIDYDPCFPRMNIAREDAFKYHVISALWDIAMAQ